MKVLGAIKKKKVDVLIATDVAARGLDIPSISTVVSYDVAHDIETHTHRVGRTGRAGAKGEAHTLLARDAEDGRRMAALLAESLEACGQEPSEDLKNLALRYAPYRAAKLAGKKFEGKKKGIGGKVVQSTFGVGFDGVAHQKETPKEFEERLNREADTLAAVNHRIMAKAGAGRAGFVAATGMARGTAGFVAAALVDEPPPLPKKPVKEDSSSDDADLFAPGVTSAFGKAPPARKPAATSRASAPEQQQQQLQQYEQQQQ